MGLPKLSAAVGVVASGAVASAAATAPADKKKR